MRTLVTENVDLATHYGICICRSLQYAVHFHNHATVSHPYSIYRFYTFKACEEFYKEKYPEYTLMLIFNAVMVLVRNF